MKVILHMFRASTTSGNQGKLEGIFPVREKLGNLAIFKKNQVIPSGTKCRNHVCFTRERIPDEAILQHLHLHR